MPTRKNLGNPNGGSIHQPDRIQSGYQGSNVPDDFHIPSCGIGDVDRAFFNLFDKDINYSFILPYLNKIINWTLFGEIPP